MSDRPSSFIDTSVIVEHLVNPHSTRTIALFERVRSLQESIHLSDTVILEVLFVLEKKYGAEREPTATSLIMLLSQRGIVLPTKEQHVSAMEYWVKQPPLSYADCFHLVMTKALGLTKIYSFDKKMGRYPGVERVEP